MDNNIQITFNTDNAAFGITQTEKVAEITNILNHLADTLNDNPSLVDETIPLRDLNGNTIGEFRPFIE